ncbi:MAG: STAS domain protein [Spirochaetes bacterium ADurb.Bin218]|jgi:anti-anti-sigma factor|nr:MAG: STAS domain protein [Spirochaetes bacterium ADurb.Bin218]
MNYKYSYYGDILIISFIRSDGSLISGSVESFANEIIALLKGNEVKVALDLRKINYINSFGLGELINMREFFLSRGITPVLILESKKIYKLFEMVGIHELFVIVSHESEI